MVFDKRKSKSPSFSTPIAVTDVFGDIVILWRPILIEDI